MPDPALDPAAPDAPAPNSPSADPRMPDYKGEPLSPDLGPGLGCFWIQIVALAVLLVATPLSVVLVAPAWFSAALLFVTLTLLLFVGQTTIFLLRLVAADRRSQRRPLRQGARPTVGQLEDEARSARSDEAAAAGQAVPGDNGNDA